MMKDKNQKPKSRWQQTKEGWYEKVPLSVKQLDVIIWLGIAVLVAVVVLVVLEANGIFYLFGK